MRSHPPTIPCKRRNKRLAVRRLPALPPVERRLGLRHQVLNGDLLITLEARARRGIDTQRHFPVNRKPGDARTAPPRRRLVLRRMALWPFCGFLHAGRLVRRARRQTLRPRDLVLQRLVLNPQPRRNLVRRLARRPQPLDFANQLANHADQLFRRHAFKQINRARRHARLKSSFH